MGDNGGRWTHHPTRGSKKGDKKGNKLKRKDYTEQL